MDKRAFLAIALSILILVIYQEWMTRYYGTPTVAPEAEKKEAEKAPAAEQLKPAPASVPQTKPVPAPPSKEVKEINVETDNYIAVFTNQGARLKSFKFKKYRSAVKDNSPPFDIVQSAPGVPLPLGVRWQSPEPFDDDRQKHVQRGIQLPLFEIAQIPFIASRTFGNLTAGESLSFPNLP